MQIKRFEAKNMTAALRMIKGELGPDAIILSARSLRKGKGFFGSMRYAGVEVTAAIDKQPQGSVGANPARAQDFYFKLKNGYAAYADSVRPKDDPPADVDPDPRRQYMARRARKNMDAPGDSRTLSAWYQQILAQEIDRGIASQLIDEIKDLPASPELLAQGDISEHLATILEEMGVGIDGDAFSAGRPRIFAVIGTTGVGKTTTIAKLASIQANRHKKGVALITLDNYGIAANEQLKTYARITGIPLEAAINPTELKRAVKTFKNKDIIFIDTPGINPADQHQVLELKAYLANLPEVQIHLVVSATTKEKDLNAVAEKFKEIGAQRLLFTRIDESSTFGNIVNLLIRSNLPLSFLSRGRIVPHDIEPGSMRRLVELLFPPKTIGAEPATTTSGQTAAATVDADDLPTQATHFVANKNSDVYHDIDCQWSRKIKPDNIIQFASSQEAEAQNFLPCRSCNPDRAASRETLGLKTAKFKLSNFR
jgi:flagellar biosynthesis protein FlhF